MGSDPMNRQEAAGTYVYCVIAGRRAPALRRGPKGLAGAGPVRLLEVRFERAQRLHGLRCWLVVADVPLDRYGEAAIQAGLANLDWVSRAAVAHEAVVERFITAAGLLPMKLFTIFTTDDRAVAYIREQGRRIERVLERVLNRDEWGVRVMLNGAASRTVPARVSASSGSGYLERKKAQRDAAVELVERARLVVAELYDRLAVRSSLARRRTVATVGGGGGQLLLDAVFLVPRARASAFKSIARRQAQALKPQGYRLSLTGPWPPYSFIED
jgi:hypothetical protein